MPASQPRVRPVDAHVGARVRARRTLLGLSQQKLGAELNLTFQQVQKYERGTNRIGASRLFELSRILDVPVGYFFEDMPPELAGGRPAPTGDEPDVRETLAKRETLELIRAFHRIKDTNVRTRLASLVRALGDASDKA